MQYHICADTVSKFEKMLFLCIKECVLLYNKEEKYFEKFKMVGKKQKVGEQNYWVVANAQWIYMNYFI